MPLLPKKLVSLLVSTLLLAQAGCYSTRIVPSYEGSEGALDPSALNLQVGQKIAVSVKDRPVVYGWFEGIEEGRLILKHGGETDSYPIDQILSIGTAEKGDLEVGKTMMLVSTIVLIVGGVAFLAYLGQGWDAVD